MLVVVGSSIRKLLSEQSGGTLDLLDGDVLRVPEARSRRVAPNGLSVMLVYRRKFRGRYFARFQNPQRLHQLFPLFANPISKAIRVVDEEFGLVCSIDNHIEIWKAELRHVSRS